MYVLTEKQDSLTKPHKRQQLQFYWGMASQRQGCSKKWYEFNTDLLLNNQRESYSNSNDLNSTKRTTTLASATAA